MSRYASSPITPELYHRAGVAVIAIVAALILLVAYGIAQVFS